MTNADIREFAELWMGLAEIYNEPVSKTRLELSFQLLRDLPFDAVRQAALRHAQTNKFFPRPAELREQVTGSVEDRAEQSWNGLRKEIRRVGWMGEPVWPDAATKATVLDMFGSWRAVCEQMPETGPEMLGLAKRFASTYGALTRTTLAPALPPASRSDDAALLRDRMRSISEHTASQEG